MTRVMQGGLACWLLLLRLQEWRTEPVLLPATVSGSPRTWLSRFPSRAPLITPISPDCTRCPGMLGRQELFEESCASRASWCSPDSRCYAYATSRAITPLCSDVATLKFHFASASRQASSFAPARRPLEMSTAKQMAPMLASVPKQCPA